MALPEPILDDLRFQKDLVDEARRRIIRYCPEWTDYNLSDPGITLIELFAWMTEMITYRLNLVPDKNYIRFMDFLGIRLMPATSARTELTFRTSTPFPLATDNNTVAAVPQGTQVATRPTDEQKEVIFTTDEKLVIAAPVITQLRLQDEVTKTSCRVWAWIRSSLSSSLRRKSVTLFISALMKPGLERLYPAPGLYLRADPGCRYPP